MKPSLCCSVGWYLVLLLMCSTTSAKNRTSLLQDSVARHLQILNDLEEIKMFLGDEYETLKNISGGIIGFAEKDSSILLHPKAPHGVKPGLGKTITQTLDIKTRGEKDDYSVCCSTREHIYFNETMVNYFGKTKKIAQVNEIGYYQMIRHGFCGDRGLCIGQCDQIYANVPLIVHPTNPGDQVSFSFFKIPTYCTCRVSAYSSRRSVNR